MSCSLCDMLPFAVHDLITMCCVVVMPWCVLLQAPILVEPGLLRVMECALWADTSFLAGLGVMDYSLLVGE